MNVAIIGSGLQCNRRAQALAQLLEDKLTLIVGTNHDSVHEVAARFNCSGTTNPDEAFERKDIDIIIVATPPSSHYEYAEKALLSGKHVLLEKPMTKLVSESQRLLSLSRNSKAIVRCGFNHRFHPSLLLLKRELQAGRIGKPIFGRAVYGMTGREGFENEWRDDPMHAAGGQFVEQGSHLIDLYRWTIGEVSSIYCATSRVVFPNHSLDDGGMAILTFENRVTASMHTTLGQWHNRFNFEIFGDEGFLSVDGLGGSYGVETLSIGERSETGPFQKELCEFRGSDKSWEIEWQEFHKAIRGEPSLIATVEDGLQVMRIAIAGYASDIDKTERQVSAL